MPPGINILAQALAEGFCAGIVAGVVITVFPVYFG